MRRLCSIVCIFFLLLSSFVMTDKNDMVSAESNNRALITVDALNVRSGPGLDYPIIVQVHKNHKYPILSKNKDWLQIKVGSKKGWIASWYAEELSVDNAFPSDGNGNREWIRSKVEGLNVRNGPDTSFQVIGTIAPQQTYQLLDTKGSWTKIRYHDTTAWVASWLVESVEKEKKITPSNHSTVSATSLNIRSGPGTNHSVVGSLRKGDKVDVLQRKEGWSQIQYNQLKGWVAERYLTNGPPKTASPIQPKKAKVTVSILNVRNQGSLQGKIVGQLTKGTTVTIVETKNNWAYIESDQTKGWTASWFLQEIDNENTNSSENEPFVALLHDGTNLRSGPSTSHPVIHRGDMGDQFPLVAKVGDWYKIRLENNKEAYVAGWIVSVAGSSLPGVSHPTVGDHLRGKTIVLDPGHGGHDSGAVGVAYGSLEKDLNLKVGLAVAAKLQAAGAKVILTRTDHRYVSLHHRVTLSHMHNADAFISLHFNSSTFPSARGINSFYYSKTKDTKLATSIQDEIVRQTGLSDRGVLFGNYQVLRTNNRPSVLLELGFLSNSQEEHYIRTSTYMDKSAHGIYRGLAQYFSKR
ncbi:SH3 domain-containing protein [Pseudalkalibacillus sp. SCS-8]|uniref:SH3 domain-containing protein n=1 Tax=Pseudalkalibacillus nanhaiensis TaxID=3115291 RepID=UPI0032DA6C4B